MKKISSVVSINGVGMKLLSRQVFEFVNNMYHILYHSRGSNTDKTDLLFIVKSLEFLPRGWSRKTIFYKLGLDLIWRFVWNNRSYISVCISLKSRQRLDLLKWKIRDSFPLLTRFDHKIVFHLFLQKNLKFKI